MDLTPLSVPIALSDQQNLKADYVKSLFGAF